MTEHLLVIDGNKFDVMLIKIGRKASILDKYARRTADGDLRREVIGTYYNYSLTFAYNDEPLRYKILWDKLTEPTEFHDIVIVDTVETMAFKGYIADVNDEIVYASPTDGYKRKFNSLSCELIAKLPSRRRTT